MKKVVSELQAQYDDALKERLHHQKELDESREYYDELSKNIEQKDVEIYLKANEIESQENEHRVEKRVYEVKLKHMKYKHQNEINDIKTATAEATHREEIERIIFDKSIRVDEASIRDDIHEQSLVFCEEVRKMKDNQSNELEKIKLEEERFLLNKQTELNKKLEQTKEQLEQELEQNLQLYKDKKEKHLQLITIEHKKSIDNLKDYYKKITNDYMNSTESLVDEISIKETSIANFREKIKELKLENERLLKPLEEVTASVHNLKHIKLKNLKKDELSLHNIKHRLIKSRKEFKRLQESLARNEIKIT